MLSHDNSYEDEQTFPMLLTNEESEASSRMNIIPQPLNSRSAILKSLTKVSLPLGHVGGVKTCEYMCDS